MFKVNNKNTKTTSLMSLNIFHTIFRVSIVDFGQVNACRDDY